MLLLPSITWGRNICLLFVVTAIGFIALELLELLLLNGLSGARTKLDSPPGEEVVDFVGLLIVLTMEVDPFGFELHGNSLADFWGDPNETKEIMLPLAPVVEVVGNVNEVGWEIGADVVAMHEEAGSVLSVKLDADFSIKTP